MICVVIDAAADAAGAAGAAEGVAPIRMTGTTTGGRYGTRVQVRDGGLTAPALTTDTEWDLKTGDGTGVPATDKTGGRIPAHWPGPPFCVVDERWVERAGPGACFIINRMFQNNTFHILSFPGNNNH